MNSWKGEFLMTNTKKKHGNKRKLLGAIGMLTVSAAMLVSSTFAWFSLNRSVTATSMSVTAKSNAKFLLVGDDATNAASAAKTDAAGVALTTTHAALKVTTQNDDNIVYPVDYYKTAGTLGTQATTANSWWTAYNGNSNNATNAIFNAMAVTEGDKDYMIHYQLWLTLSNGSEDYTGKLRTTFSLSDLGQDTADAATSAVVSIGGSTTEKQKLNSTTTTFTTTNDVTITDSTALAVDVYVFIDGNATNVYTDYIADGTKISGEVGLGFAIENPNTGTFD